MNPEMNTWIHDAEQTLEQFQSLKMQGKEGLQKMVENGLLDILLDTSIFFIQQHIEMLRMMIPKENESHGDPRISENEND